MGNKLVSVVLAVALCVGAVLLGVPAGASATSVLRSHLLSRSDLPAGWKAVATTSRGGLTKTLAKVACLSNLAKFPKGTRYVSAHFQMGTSPELKELLAAGRGSAALYKKAVHDFTRCTTFTIAAGNQSVQGTITPLAFPKVGATSRAFSGTLSDAALKAGVDIVAFKAAGDVGFVILGALGTPSVTTTETYARKAVAKVEAKPAAVKKGSSKKHGGTKH